MALFRTVLAVDFVLALFPPLHWWVSSDSVGISLVYFVGSAALITASVFVLAALSPRDEEAR